MLDCGNIDNDGCLHWMYKANSMKGEVKHKRLAPGVLKVWIDKWDAKRKAIDVKLTTCAYKPAFNKCECRIEEGTIYCETHKELKCTCGEQATHECTYCSPYNSGYPSCMTPLCDKNCKHNCK